MIYLSKYNFFKNPDFLHTHLGSFKGLNKTPVNKGLVGMQYYYFYFFFLKISEYFPIQDPYMDFGSSKMVYVGHHSLALDGEKSWQNRD